MFVRWRSKDLIARSQKAPSPRVVGPAALFGAAEAAGVDVFAMIREEPGNVSVKTIEREVFKLNAIRKVGLPDVLFADVAPKVPLSLKG
ncbi:hypothetical protein GCM10017673_43250 [Streptosporangium violaceochromogenes]|nr:hypothetical protein GCM10017673_43250 [Streptosporangium violaceochromogenes]